MPKQIILIADDQDDIRALVRITLGEDDFAIIEAASGEDALALARAAQPDIILLDVWMPPGIDGFEVCRQLRQASPEKLPKIIMLTAAGREQDRRRATEVGADGYFVKPFSPLALLDRVYQEMEE